jgi:hypothetical protein
MREYNLITIMPSTSHYFVCTPSTLQNSNCYINNKGIYPKWKMNSDQNRPLQHYAAAVCPHLPMAPMRNVYFMGKLTVHLSQSLYHLEAPYAQAQSTSHVAMRTG